MRINPFKAWRPAPEKAGDVASVPYDVVNTKQAAALAEGNPDSFLHVVRAEIDLPDGTDLYSNAVYAKANENLQRMMADGTLIREEAPSFYLYSQQMGDHLQYGIVAGCHIEDYENGLIKIHEKTRKIKEQDRTRYVDELNANTGPVFLTCKDSDIVGSLMEQIAATKPLYQFTATDGITHTVWKIEETGAFAAAFAEVPAFYVADGHHRSASAAKVGAMRRAANPDHNGSEPYNWFLAVIFPESQLKILPYNRVVLSLGDQTADEFFQGLEQSFSVEANGQKEPSAPGSVCMYTDGKWFELTPKESIPTDPVGSLDVSILQDRVLAPLLGIDDPRESDDIDFVGGIHGTAELERRVNEGEAVVAFSLYPTTIAQLMDVADAGLLMPPKSTWFEPKLRSGLLVNTLD
ncbi:DUF1015 domain-containing protein [Tichowtungia aerotolerans]|uniref:DUF1015 family protein n=1 Tax=Tichowtungia aerotolerans TaxID=2697043 RepID=A0A6P1M7C0_9BACT|nr:DUF1015 family protein [Tichowtungia aerotolerans]QHI68078.1 DUF1015 family protein [Tichowtungia aerotolerans]